MHLDPQEKHRDNLSRIDEVDEDISDDGDAR